MKNILKGLNKFILHSYDVIEAVGAATVVTIILIVSSGILSRYVFNQALVWVEEVCCLLLIWLCYLAASLTTVEKQHVVADFLSSKLPVKFAAVESYIIRLLEVIFLFTTAYAAIKLIPSLTHTSAALQIPRKWYYMPVIVFSIYMGLAIVVDLLNELCPGYDYFAQRQKLRDAEEARLQDEENQAMIERENALMDAIAAENENGGAAK